MPFWIVQCPQLSINFVQQLATPLLASMTLMGCRDSAPMWVARIYFLPPTTWQLDSWGMHSRRDQTCLRLMLSRPGLRVALRCIEKPKLESILKTFKVALYSLAVSDFETNLNVLRKPSPWSGDVVIELYLSDNWPWCSHATEERRKKKVELSLSFLSFSLSWSTKCLKWKPHPDVEHSDVWNFL